MKVEEEEVSNSSSELAKIINGSGSAFNMYETASGPVLMKEEELSDNDDPKSLPQPGFTWTSLWPSGPRRSAFQPYKSQREPVLSVRPVSTPIMTNVQRGNKGTQAASPAESLSWFTLCGRGDITDSLVEKLVSQGTDIDRVDEEGMSGLMWAAYHGQIYAVQLLLTSADIKVNRRSVWGQTALMMAATEGHLEIVRLLIEEGADVNAEDSRRSTALMCAVYNDHPHTVNELLINGAELWTVNVDKDTAYDIAITRRSKKSKRVLENYIHSLVTAT